MSNYVKVSRQTGPYKTDGAVVRAHDAVDRLTDARRDSDRSPNVAVPGISAAHEIRPARTLFLVCVRFSQHVCAGRGGLFVFLYLPRRPEVSRIHTKRHFPYWGWLSGLFLLCFWMLAWRRFTWFKPLQSFTFAPLWTSYVVFVNALTFRRTGDCLLTQKSRYLVALFPASALFGGISST